MCKVDKKVKKLSSKSKLGNTVNGIEMKLEAT